MTITSTVGSGSDNLAYYAVEGGLTINLTVLTPQNTGAAGTDTILNIEHLHGGFGDDFFTGNSADNQLHGSDGNDTLIGNGGQDFLFGGVGEDSMDGGDGNDFYNVDDDGDVVVETGSDPLVGGNDIVSSYLDDYTLPANIEGGSIQSDGPANLTGNSLNNYLYAGKGDNTIDGGDGNDFVSYSNEAHCTGVSVSLLATEGQYTGGSGLDYLIGIENISGTNYDDSLTGDAGMNTLDGRAGNDTLIGGGGNDYFVDSSGDDVIDGGADSDTVSYSTAFAAVSVNLSIDGTQNTGGAGSDYLISIERLYGTFYDDTLTGDSAANTVGGNAGNDSIGGGGGNDTLYGDSGNDTLTGGADADQFMFMSMPGGGTLTDKIGVDRINDFVVGTDKIVLDNNLFTALIGIGTLSNSGTRLRSGAGVTTAADADDFLIYDTTDGKLYYDADGNLGTYSPIHFLTVSAGESGPAALTAANIDVFGLAGNTVSGTSSNDTLVGGSGNDILNGLEGNDDLSGLAGNDSLDGGVGADTMAGGEGNDTYYVDNVGDVVTETGTNGGNFSFGGDRVISSLPTYTLGTNIEEGQISGAGADIVGNSLHNALFASTGNNVIDGADGSDTVNYSLGATSGVIVSLLLTGAQNTGGSGTDTLTNIEHIFGSGFNDLLTGNTLNNSLSGSSGNDTLVGGDGNDTLSDFTGDDSFDGGGGFDTLSFLSNSSAITVNLNTVGVQNTGAGNDTITGVENLSGGAGADLFTGNSLNNLLMGNDGNDTLIGGAGNDTLEGGLGNDILTGGTGADADAFNFFSTLNGISNVDIITDFAHGTDKIVLSNSVFTSLKISGQLVADNLRIVSGSVTAGDENDYLIYHMGTGNLYYDADGNGGGSTPIHFATLQNTPSNFSASDIQVSTFFTFTSGAGTSDTLTGTTGADYLSGLGGNDILNGGDGDDVLEGGSGNDSINGGPGSDTASYQAAADNAVVELGRGKALDGDGGNDALTDIENINGSGWNDILIGTSGVNFIKGSFGNDFLYGYEGNDTLLGGEGDDWLRGGIGNDYIDGGNGNDTADYSQANNAIVANLDGGNVSSDGLGGADLLLGIENLLGSVFNDTLDGDDYDNLFEGGNGDDYLYGWGGDDALIGGAGDDELFGGDGADFLVGGRGADEFVLDSGDGADFVLDFDSAQGDKLVIEYEFGSVGSLTAANFRSGAGVTAAADPDDYFIYDTTTGALYYDQSGNDGGAGPVQILTLVGAPALAFDDIFINITAV